MGINYKYILEPYNGMKSRYTCPYCNSNKKTFVRYIDNETGQHLADHVGRCEKLDSCGVHYTPKQYFSDNNISFDKILTNVNIQKVIKEPQQKEISFIPVEIFKKSLQPDKDISEISDTNSFIKYLIGLFGVEVTHKIIKKYQIGTSKHWSGATVFWQMDINNRIRAGKIMLYNAITGKRIKEPFNYITWVHKALKIDNFNLQQCFFGEHLLNNSLQPVAIVESEKTAIIASVYLPQFVWIAAGNKEGLNKDKCEALKGRTVVLFPDLKAFEKWNEKAKEFSNIAQFTVSDLLETKASEADRQKGFDLADYLIKFDYRLFNKPKQPEAIPEKATQKQLESKICQKDIELPKATLQQPQQNEVCEKCEKSESPEKTLFFENNSEKTVKKEPQPLWNIRELENYFSKIQLPTEPIKFNNYSIIENVSVFIENHLAVVNFNNGKRTFLPYLNRLQDLKILLKNMNNN